MNYHNQLNRSKTKQKLQKELKKIEKWRTSPSCLAFDGPMAGQAKTDRVGPFCHS